MALEDIEVITQFINKATVWILAFVYDVDKALVDPTAIKITVVDPDGATQVNAEAMTKYDSQTGIYEYLYHKGESEDPMDSGEWRGRIDVIDGSGASAVISPQGFGFKVK